MASRPPSASELVAMRSALQSLGVSSRAAEPHFRTLEVKRHALLMSAGDDANQSGFVVSGVVREYYVLEDGTERTRGFALPGDTFGSLADALARRPTRVFVRAEAESVVLAIDWSRVEALAETSLEWERFRYALVRRLYLRKSAREYELLGLDAAGRYRSLLAQQPTLEQHVSQSLIASYLGITPVHLSRLRGAQRAQRRRASKLQGPAPK